MLDNVVNSLQSCRNWLLLIGFLLLVFWMGSQELEGVFWVDEVRAAYRAGDARYGGEGTLAEVWERSANIYDQTPGYYLILALWGRLVGLDEVSGRSLSLFVGVLAIAVTYRIGRDIHSPLAGLGAAVVMGSSAIYMIYLHDMRTYSLLVLMTSLAIWSYWRLTTHPPKFGFYGLLLLALTVMLYSHYFASIIVGALGLYHLIFGKRGRSWWSLLFVFALSGLLFLPWVANVVRIISGANADVLRHMGAFTLPIALREIFFYFTNGTIIVGVLLCVLALPQMSRQGVRLVWFVLVVGLALALIVNAFLHMLSEVRYLLVLWVPLALVSGVGIARLAKIAAPPVWLTCWGLLLVSGVWNNFDPSARITLDSPNKYLPWDTLAKDVYRRDENGDVLIFSFQFEGWDGDHWETSAHYLTGSSIKPNLLRSLPAMTDQAYLQEAQGYVQNAKRVWSAYDNMRLPWRMGMFEQRLSELGFYDCGVVSDHPDLHIDLYSRLSESPLPYRFAAEGDIEVELLEDINGTANTMMPFSLGWRLGEGIPPNTYSLGLHLLDSNGALAAQYDYGIPQAPAGCVTGAVNVSGLTPGDYTVNLIAYAWETGTRLTGFEADSDNPQESLLLTKIRVN